MASKSLYDALIIHLLARTGTRADIPLTTQEQVDAVFCGYRPKEPKQMAPRKPGSPF